MKHINGVSARIERYEYKILPEMIGQLVIPPIRVITDRGTYDSQIIKAEVVQAQQVAGVPQSNALIACTLTVDQRNVVVGEHVTYTIQAQYQPNVITIHSLMSPTIDNVQMIDIVGPTPVSSHNQSMQIIEWKGSFYAKKTGPLTLTPACIYYFERDNSIFSRMGIFGGFAPRAECYSQPLDIVVDQLPRNCSAIGRFSEYVVRADRTSVPCRQAVRLSSYITGSGTFDECEPAVINISGNCKIYHAPVLKKNSDTTIHYSDSVVQPLEDGFMNIPMQDFVYFDTALRTCVTLHADPSVIHVSHVEIEPQLPCIDSTDTGVQVIQEVYTPYYRFCDRWYVPWQIMLCILFLCALFVIINKYCYRFIIFCMFKFFTYRLLYAARKRLARKQSTVYDIFKELFVFLLQKYSDDISEQDIECFLVRNGLPDADVAEWRIFWNHALEDNFSDKDGCFEKDSLYTRARYWILLFQKKIV
ncbi:MAG: BatD family protein [Candidatus Babeliaceae bacterium]|jgi:hypothetical protein